MYVSKKYSMGDILDLIKLICYMVGLCNLSEKYYHISPKTYHMYVKLSMHKYKVYSKIYHMLKIFKIFKEE